MEMVADGWAKLWPEGSQAFCPPEGPLPIDLPPLTAEELIIAALIVALGPTTLGQGRPHRYHTTGCKFLPTSLTDATLRVAGRNNGR